jgi:single-strand DNA-binding protein
MDLNKVMLIGNLTRDPETRSTPTGQTVTSFGIATNRSWTDAAGVRQEKAEFHNIVSWGKLAEICGQYLSKGRKIYLEGRLQTRDWTGDDGVRRFKTEVVADNMIILDKSGKPAQGQGEANDGEENKEIPAVDDKEIKVENIPF